MSLIKYTTKVLSVLFRVLLIVFALFIVSIKQNAFEYYTYYIIAVPYLLLYFFCIFKEGWYSKLRLLNDFLFLTFVAYGKDIDLYIIIFLALPIINSPNYSGEKKSILLYVFFLLSLFIVNDFTWLWNFLVITIILFLVNILSSLRQSYTNNISKLNSKIDEFLEKDFDVNKSYKIYDGLKEAINSIIILIGFKPEISQIVCFRIDKGTFFLENSSDFIWSYSLNKKYLLKQIANNAGRSNFDAIEININNVSIENNFFIYNKTKNEEFVFIFINKKPIENTIGLIYLKKILYSATNRISRVIAAEREIKTNKKIMLSDFRKKYFQIQNAEKAMHFIRNRFNTLDNFIEMSKDNIAGKMDSEDLKLYRTELDRLERSYAVLMERVKSILDKNDKPFSAANLESKSVNYAFNMVREAWSDYFLEFNVNFKVDFKKTEKQNIKINTDGFYILISDWISNLKKYSKGGEVVTFDEDERSFIIIFENDFTPESYLEIESLKNDFNSTERDKILQRTSYGVLIMKSILEEMNMQGCIDVMGSKLKLILTIKKQTDENSNI